MWKKPSMEKPDFKRLCLQEISGKESLETNGGRIADLISIDPVIIPKEPIPNPPIVLSGFVGPNFKITAK